MLTPAQRDRRRRYLGSSDAPSVLGCSPYRTRGDVFLEKTVELLEEVPDASAAIAAGNLVEGALVEWAGQLLERPVERDLMFVHPTLPLCANLDGLVRLGNQRLVIVEAKTAGLVGRPAYLDDFGTPGTDELPAHVLVQVHHQMAVVHAALEPVELSVLVVALVGGRGPLRFDVARHPDLEAAIVREEVAFWEQHVRPGIAPPDELPALETLKRLRREPNATVPVPSDLVRAWVAARDRRLEGEKALEAAEDQAKRALLVALGHAEAGTCDLGVVTNFETVPRPPATPPKPRQPYRVLRFKKAEEAHAE